VIRRVVSLLCALSLLLCAATVVLWVRSYHRVDVIAIPSTRLHRVVLGGGGFFWESLAFEREDGNWRSRSAPVVRRTVAYDAWEAAQPRLALRRWTTAPYLGRSRLAGTSWGGDFNRIRPRFDQVSFVRQEKFDNVSGASVTFRLGGWRMWIPCWLLFVVSALPPVYWLTRRPARPTGGSVPCPNCGYDLRASKDRCPECGTPIPLGHHR
jgi:hypothetical protein